MEKKKSQITLGVIVAILVILFFSTKRIDAGHAGIKVYNYGDDKGVSNVVEVTGWTLYNPLSQKVYEVPTYVQTANYIHDTIEGINNELRFNTRDGMVVRINASLNYNTPSQNVVMIFQKYRKPVQQLEQTILRNKIVDAINSICSNYSCEEVYEKRNKFEAECKKHLKETLGKEGFVLEDFVILGELKLPHSVVTNINNKINAVQISMTKEQEVKQQYYDALKSITKARGDSSVAMISASGKANAMLVTADAEAKSNQKISSTITDVLIRYNQAQSWNGQYPTTLVTNGQNVMLPLSK
jgi:regulator of protease activity HflC (stomatin/prohibitin superfamily)